ncbi:hypothetical protein ACJJTC_006464 [Scirpophaga incertulas]
MVRRLFPLPLLSGMLPSPEYAGQPELNSSGGDSPTTEELVPPWGGSVQKVQKITLKDGDVHNSGHGCVDIHAGDAASEQRLLEQRVPEVSVRRVPEPVSVPCDHALDSVSVL